MKIYQIRKYSIIDEMCSLILNNANSKEMIQFYEFYFTYNMNWFDENLLRIIDDFTILYNSGKLDFAIKHWTLKYTSIYSDIVKEGVMFFEDNYK